MAKIKTDDFLLYTGLGNQINGDNVVGMTAPSKMTGVKGLGDKTNVLAYMTSDNDKDGMKKYLGLIELFNTTHDMQVPIQMDLLKNLSVIDVEPEAEIGYDINIPKDHSRYAEVVSEVENEDLYPNTPFKLVLDREYTAGDLLTHNPTSDYEVRVSREHDVEPYGEGWLHYVLFVSNDPKKQYPKGALRAGVKWIKKGNFMAEYGTQWSGISTGMSKPGVLNMLATLPSPQGIETAWTIRGGNIKTRAASELSKDTVSFIEDEMAKLGGFEKSGTMFTGKYKQNGELTMSRISSTLEYIAMKELVLMNSYSNMFAIASEEHTEDGVVRVNEGAWRQARRGKIITYPRAGGITINHLQEMANYLFKNNSVPVNEREIKVRGGYEAYNNVSNLISNHAQNQFSTIQNMVGTDSQIKPVFTGDNDNLTMGIVKIAKAFFNGVGWVTAEHDRSFDYKPISSGAEDDYVSNGFNSTTYSLVIDAYQAMGSAQGKFGSGAKLVEGGSLRSNFFYMKPNDGTHFFYGHNTGRAPFQGVSSDLRASLRYMGHEFFASMRSWIMMVDTTSHVIIELQDTYLN